MALDYSDDEWVLYLSHRHDADLPKLRYLNSLYEGTAPMYYMHPEVQRELEGRVKAVSLGWAMFAVDPVGERLEGLGFRYPDEDGSEPDESASGDANLQRVWQDNDLDEESSLGHTDSLVMKRSYVAVGSNEEDGDTPLVTVESPLEVYADIDPRTRRVRAALRRFEDDGDNVVRIRERYNTLMLPDKTVWMRWAGKWVVDDVDQHNLGEVPIVPIVNRARLADRYGASELTPALLSLSHAANKIATDMMVAAEFHAIPLRAVFGIRPEDLVDEKGNRLSALQVIMGRLLVAGDDGNAIKPHEFSASSLANFHDTMNQLAKHVAGLLGLPPHMLGMATDNPPSAEAIRSAEARLVKRVEQRQLAFGGSWERAMRLVRRFQDGDWDPRAKRLEMIWRDASTPTRAQAADAAVKLFTTPTPIVTLRQVREDLGYTPGQIKRMEAEDKEQAANDPMAEIARGLAVPSTGLATAKPAVTGDAA